MNRNGFVRKKVESSLTLGEKLKKMRGDGRISFREISKSTKIQVKYLEALEKGEYDKLPADVYVRGFLRSYALHLGVNEKALISLYEREKGIRKNIVPEKENENNIQPLVFNRFAVTSKMILVISGILIGAGSFYYLYRQLDQFVSTPRLVLISPIDGEVVERETIMIEGMTDHDARVFINNQPTVVGENGDFSEIVTLHPGLNTVQVMAKNKFDKEVVKVFSVQSDITRESSFPLNGDSQVAAAQTERQLFMEVVITNTPTWLWVEADGNLVYSGTLDPNEPQSFSAMESIKITSGGADQTLVRLNGHDLGKLGDEKGIARDILFTLETLEDFLKKE